MTGDQPTNGGTDQLPVINDKLLCTLVKGLANSAHESVVIDVAGRTFDDNEVMAAREKLYKHFPTCDKNGKDFLTIKRQNKRNYLVELYHRMKELGIKKMLVNFCMPWG